MSSFALPVGAEFTALPDSADLTLTIADEVVGPISLSNFASAADLASSVQSRITGFLIIDRPDLAGSVEVESTASGVSIVLSSSVSPISIDASFSFDPSAQQTHVYHKDLTTGELSVVDITPSGTLSSMEANGESIDVSDDGSLVAFQSQALSITVDGPGISTTTVPHTDMVSGVTGLSQHGSVYVRDMSVTSGSPISLVNAAADGTPSDDNSRGSATVISGDGRLVAFVSDADNLVPGVSDGTQLYVKNLETGEIVIGGSSSTGEVPSGDVAITSMSFSSNGRFLVFESSAQAQTLPNGRLLPGLVEGDTNGLRDVFVKDLETGAIERVSVGVDGTQVDEDARVIGISDDGSSITFISNASSIDPFGNNGSDVFLVANPLHPSAQATASGQLTITDDDAGEAFFVAETVEGDFGSLTVTADGAWTYTLDPDFSITGDITSVDDTITVQSVDGTTQSIAVTINSAGSVNVAPEAVDD
ncbi:MAG: VCBS domain-containing protein, partial [Actinomycetota bacterium]|nr:VCBS domain-containing protein [Actinomycetota bacterium]